MGLSDIVGSILKPIGEYFNRRQEIKAEDRQQDREMQKAIHERQVELVKLGLAADATWEIEQIKNSGWKDEWVLVLLSIPLVGCFVPGLAGYIMEGFTVLMTTPDWYRWLIMLIFTAIYGIRIWRRQQSDT